VDYSLTCTRQSAPRPVWPWWLCAWRREVNVLIDPTVTHVSVARNFSSIFTFAAPRSSLAHMNRFWFSASYYYGFFGYNRRGLQSRAR
jgi:hypothetical protein